eukprot:2156715-Amphidinium_carterae.1
MNPNDSLKRPPPAGQLQLSAEAARQNACLDPGVPSTGFTKSRFELVGDQRYAFTVANDNSITIHHFTCRHDCQHPGSGYESLVVSPAMPHPQCLG